MRLLILLAIAMLGLVACSDGRAPARERTPSSTPAAAVIPLPQVEPIPEADTCDFEPRSFLTPPATPGLLMPLPIIPTREPANEGPAIFIAGADSSNPTPLSHGYSAVWSPDGTKVAVRSNVTGGLGGTYDIVVVDVASKKARVIATASWSDTGSPGPVSWSPDSCLLTFSDSGFVYIVPSDGSEQPLAVVRGLALAWSPSGNLLAMRPEAVYPIHLLDLESGELRPLPILHAFRWSPDGRRMLYELRDIRPGEGLITDLYLFDLVTGEERLLDSRPGAVLNSSEDAAWSPDGQRILLVVPSLNAICTEPGVIDPDECLNASDIVVIDPSRPNEGITVGQGFGRVGWTPDGRSIAFRRFEDKEPWFYLAPADGSSPAQRFLQADELSWSPSGDRLVFTP